MMTSVGAARKRRVMEGCGASWAIADFFLVLRDCYVVRQALRCTELCLTLRKMLTMVDTFLI